MNLILYCDLDPMCWILHLVQTCLLIMFYFSVKFAEIRFSCIQIVWARLFKINDIVS